MISHSHHFFDRRSTIILRQTPPLQAPDRHEAAIFDPPLLYVPVIIRVRPRLMSQPFRNSALELTPQYSVALDIFGCLGNTKDPSGGVSYTFASHVPLRLPFITPGICLDHCGDPRSAIQSWDFQLPFSRTAPLSGARITCMLAEFSRKLTASETGGKVPLEIMKDR